MGGLVEFAGQHADAGQTAQASVETQFVAELPAKYEAFAKELTGSLIVASRPGDFRQIGQHHTGSEGIARSLKLDQCLFEIGRCVIDHSRLVVRMSKGIEREGGPVAITN